MNIPTLTQENMIKTKAVFGAVDVKNSFEAAIKKQHETNYKKYLTAKGK